MGKEQPSSYYNSKIKKMLESEYKYADLYNTAIDFLPDPKLKKPRTVVDIGCGIGSFIPFLSKKNYPSKKYLGIDFSDKLIETCKSRFPKYQFIISNLLDPNIHDLFKNYSLFVSFEVLEHIKEDLKVVEAIPSGALFVFSVPNINGSGHVRYFTSAEKVISRYSFLLDFTDEKAEITKTGKPHHKMFLFKTIRK